jgi:hypothetical protein
MPTTRRRKIARRSVAIRRVKPNAKRKTYRRKSRNIVMKGGVHESLKVYVIQKELGYPKCFIIREKSTLKDTIYLFFHSQMTPTEIEEFVCAATGLDVDTVNNLKLHSTSSENKAFNDVFVKLSGNLSYSLSSGVLSEKQGHISDRSFKEQTTPKIERKNGEAIIQSLKSMSDKKDYTFAEFTEIEYFKDKEFNLGGDLEGLIRSVMDDTKQKIRNYCSSLPILPKIKELKQLVNKQLKLDDIIFSRANGFRSQQSNEKLSKEEYDEITVATAKKYLVDIHKARQLIAEIKGNPSLLQCKTLIDDTLFSYIEGRSEFTPDIDAIKLQVNRAV